MSSPTSTTRPVLTVLRDLHAIIGNALDALDRAFDTFDFPNPDAPYDHNSPAEAKTHDPQVTPAIAHIVAACGQLSATVQAPFLTICDAIMGYHLPSCMRFFEATHVVEILRDAGPGGLHVGQIANLNGTDPNRLDHVLRLLATHHIVREVRPSVFANTRLSSFIDTGKPAHEVIERPTKKYEGTNGIAAFVGLCTDELFKVSAYYTDAHAPPPFGSPTSSSSPDTSKQSLTLGSNAELTMNERMTHRAAFNLAFRTPRGYFAWLEHGGGYGGGPASWADDDRGCASCSGGIGNHNRVARTNGGSPEARFRLERFGKAMTGTEAWEVPGAVLKALDWHALPDRAIVVDVGGGIGSTTAVLARECSHLQFVVQDRAEVVHMGEDIWRNEGSRRELLDKGVVRFQEHDFFMPQPLRDVSVFFLRVVLHDWPDVSAQRILLRLRSVASPHTRLVIAEHILPLACVDSYDSTSGMDEKVEGALGALARAPLLPNLGKSSANAYWMDMTMQTTFSAKERTLRELCTLARSAGWRVVRVVHATGASLFGHLVAVPVSPPEGALEVLAREDVEEARRTGLKTRSKL